MKVIPEAVLAGIDAGLIRSLRLLPGFQVPDPENLRRQLLSVVEPALADYNPSKVWGHRGQATYGELAAMAVAARISSRQRRRRSAWNRETRMGDRGPISFDPLDLPLLLMPWLFRRSTAPLIAYRAVEIDCGLLGR